MPVNATTRRTYITSSIRPACSRMSAVFVATEVCREVSHAVFAPFVAVAVTMALLMATVSCSLGATVLPPFVSPYPAVTDVTPAVLTEGSVRPGGWLGAGHI